MPKLRSRPHSKLCSDEDFDAMYGKGMMHCVRMIINDLAPTTRRDEWWSTEGPYEIIVMHLMSAFGEAGRGAVDVANTNMLDGPDRARSRKQHA